MPPFLKFLAELPHCQAQYLDNVVIDLRTGAVFAKPDNPEPKYRDLVRVRYAGVDPDVDFYVDGHKLARLHGRIAVSLGMLDEHELDAMYAELKDSLRTS